MSEVLRSDRIILPNEDRTNSPELLRKALLKSVESPAKREFERLRGEGMDSETAATLSGLDTYDPEYRASVILGESRDEGLMPVKSIAYDASRETKYALQNIGSSAGSAVGAALGMTSLRFVAKNARMFGIGAAAIGTVALTAFTAKVVAAAFGKVVAGVAVANVISAAAIITAAVVKKGWR